MSTESNWLDDQSPQHDSRFADQELKQLQQKYQHNQEYQEQRKDFFILFKVFVTLMFLLGYALLGYAISKPSSFSAIIATVSLMVPLVLTLAMLRMLYGNEKEKKDKPIPSITFNVGKELASVILTYLKKN